MRVSIRTRPSLRARACLDRRDNAPGALAQLKRLIENAWDMSFQARAARAAARARWAAAWDEWVASVAAAARLA